MEKENIILQYISAWSWHILGVIFLVGGFNIAFSGNDIGNNVMFVVFIIMWVISEVIAIKRQNKLQLGDDE